MDINIDVGSDLLIAIVLCLLIGVCHSPLELACHGCVAKGCKQTVEAQEKEK
jgi:hypothetical protein